jgi:hypothetical protein
LIINGGRNSIHVVSTEEKSLASQCRSKVKGRVEITFRGSTFSEICNSNTILA